MSKFQRSIARIMDSHEARAKCAEMGLDQKVTDFVAKEFDRMHDDEAHEERCSCGESAHECDRIVREDGRIGWGQDWESALEDLGRAMGLSDEDVEELRDVGYDKFPEVGRVWEAFFEE